METNEITDDLLSIIANKRVLMTIGSDADLSEMSYGFMVEKIEYWLGYMDVWRLFKFSLDWFTCHLRVTSSSLAESIKYQSDNAVLASLDDIANRISQFILDKSANSQQQRQILIQEQSEDMGTKEFKWLAIRYFYKSLVDFISIKESLYKLYGEVFGHYADKTQEYSDNLENLKKELSAYKNLGMALGRVSKLVEESRKNGDSSETDASELPKKAGIQEPWAFRMVQELV